MEAKDYKALILERKQKDRRAIVRHVICLDPELYAELEEVEQDLREARAAEASEDGPPVDRRSGGLSEVAKAELKVSEVEKRIAEVSIVGVFKTFTSAEQAERHDLLNKSQDENPENINRVVIAAAREDILLTFDHFEGPGQQRLDLTRSDLETLIETWSHGELTGLASRLGRASSGANEAPKSVRSSLLNQHSDVT